MSDTEKFGWSGEEVFAWRPRPELYKGEEEEE